MGQEVKVWLRKANRLNQSDTVNTRATGVITGQSVGWYGLNSNQFWHKLRPDATACTTKCFYQSILLPCYAVLLCSGPAPWDGLGAYNLTSGFVILSQNMSLQYVLFRPSGTLGWIWGSCFVTNKVL
jgi:hypothetical protein